MGKNKLGYIIKRSRWLLNKDCILQSANCKKHPENKDKKPCKK